MLSAVFLRSVTASLILFCGDFPAFFLLLPFEVVVDSSSSTTSRT